MSVNGNHLELGKSAELLKAPPVSFFPAHPAAWYLFCRANDLRNGPLAKQILGRDLVAFRTASGKFAVLDARCSHLGANLGCGQVVGESIQCPFHQWQFGCDGVCNRITSQEGIPAFARQQSYPVSVRHGYLFFFNAPEAFYPLPFFENEAAEDFSSGKLFSYTAEASWFMVAGQGFDRQHFESVHERRLVGSPKVSCPSQFVRRNQMDARNVGKTWRDWIQRLILGSAITLTVQNWGGTFYVVKAKFAHTCSRFIVSFRPLEDGRTHFDVIVFARRGISAWGLPLRRLFTQAHLVSESRQIRDPEYRPGRFIAADGDLIQFFCWLALLPQKLPNTEKTLLPESPTTRGRTLEKPQTH